MQPKIIRVATPGELLAKIDAIAAHRTASGFGSRVSRSEIIRAACADYVKNHAVACNTLHAKTNRAAGK
ncbi:ribbon-helix-helix domain-containing protein [Methylobacterium durans]|uniref:ribbon-helix-helix domain-containing protein n=1 Tax=Methylobacterium durans TaxID=2202825 RepID=UPI002AFDCFEE|nr:ribbon-helix-helix domain-containing protein [Methylobacterium durans]MEA1834070.1 ribbon-helix-helix domain-containing protein [Methylobacterium durans]